MMVFDRATGQWKDDGVPAAGAPPAAPGIMAQSLFPAKPETEVTTEAKTEGPQAAAARLGRTTAYGDQQVALDQQGDVMQAEARDKAAAAAAEVQAQQDEINARRDLEAKRVAERERLIADRQAKVDSEVDAKRKAGAAEADYWKGNDTGRILAAVLQGVGAAAGAVRGETGPSAVERVINTAIDRHRQKLVGEWEATKESRELKDADIAAWDREKDRIEREADRQSAVETKLRTAKVEEALSKHGGDKAEAQIAELRAAAASAHAKDETTAAQHYDRETKVTHRSPTAAPGGAGGAEKADDNLVFDPITAKPLFRATTTLQAKELNDNGAKMDRVRRDASSLAELATQVPRLSLVTGVSLDPAVQTKLKDMNRLKQGLVGQMTQMTGAGAPSGSEKKDFIDTVQAGKIEDPHAYAQSLKNFAGNVEQTWRSTTKSYGNQGQAAKEQTTGGNEKKDLPPTRKVAGKTFKLQPDGTYSEAAP